jgi:hypothetical protein
MDFVPRMSNETSLVYSLPRIISKYYCFLGVYSIILISAVSARECLKFGSPDGAFLGGMKFLQST